MREFKDGETIYIEPWRAKAFPVIKDLIVDRSAFDRVIQAGGYVSVNTSGNTIDANAVPIPKEDADDAFNAATCIGCGACVATCKNSSAMLFVSAKVSQLALLPQGQVEREERVLNMVNQMDLEGFGNCTNTGACEVECPKEISLENIARMNREYLSASVKFKNKLSFPVIQKLRITLVQSHVYWESSVKNRSQFEAKLSDTQQTDLIILPELFNTAFSVTNEGESMTGETIKWMFRLASKKKAVVLGSLIIKENCKKYNRLICMNPDGSYQYYDKRHLFGLMNESSYLTQGKNRLIINIKVKIMSTNML